MKKSLIRTNAEQALVAAGVAQKGHAFVDKSLSGQRVKFAFVFPNDEQLSIIRSTFAALNPNNDTRVWIVKAGHHYGWGGVALKVFV